MNKNILGRFTADELKTELVERFNRTNEINEIITADWLGDVVDRIDMNEYECQNQSIPNGLFIQKISDYDFLVTVTFESASGKRNDTPSSLLKTLKNSDKSKVNINE